MATMHINPFDAKRPMRNLVAGIVLIAFSLITVTLAGSTDAEAAPGKRPGHVYLLRGLLNVFSLGMDDLAYKLEATGVTATVHSYPVWRGLADDMIASYRAGNRAPIILMGHSNGADTTISLARKLNESGVPVALIVNFDPVAPEPVPPNVRQIVNFYVPTGWGQAVTPEKRFHGNLANVNESAATNHFMIDKDQDLHRKAIALVLRTVSRPRAPVAPRPAQVSAVQAQ